MSIFAFCDDWLAVTAKIFPIARFYRFYCRIRFGIGSKSLYVFVSTSCPSIDLIDSRMKKIIALLSVLFLYSSSVQAGLITLADFNAATPGVVSLNPATTIQGVSFNTNSIQGGTSGAFGNRASIGLGTLDGNAMIVGAFSNAATGAAETYRGVGEINISTILAFPNLDRSNALIRITARYDRTAAGTGTYNTLRMVANTNATGGGTYDSIDADLVTAGIQDLNLGSSGGWITQTWNLTPYLDRLDVSTTETYASLRFILNKNNDSVGTLYIDNIGLNTVPEPTSMALVGLAVGGYAVRRFRNRKKNS
jgi:hypothetical protein